MKSACYQSEFPPQRSTWIVSLQVLLAIAVFATGNASVAWGQSGARPPRLQSLVNDAVAQLQLSYRHDPAERQARYEEIGRAIDAWKKSARGPIDNERLAEWLRESMRASMPGSRTPLPSLPQFAPLASPTEGIPLPKEPPAASTKEVHEPVVAEPAERAQSTLIEPHATNDEPTRPLETVIEAPATASSSVLARPASDVAAPVGPIEDDPFRDDPLPDDHDNR
jgi:hypothetical protein